MLLALAVAGAGVALACGPFFPNSYLAQSTANLLAAPEGFFAAELARIGLTPPPEKSVSPGKDEKPRDTSAQTDIADVRRALTARGLPAARAKEIGDAYAGVRTRLGEWVAQEEQRTAGVRAMSWIEPAERARRMAALPVPSPFPQLVIPAGLPAEFAMYFTGAVAWQQGKTADARAAWAGVLALPEGERRNRAVWAAFMLGRLNAEAAGKPGGETAAAEAARFCQLTRTLAAQGLPDPLGLAAASYGWEAQAALTEKNYASAINLYLVQRTTGDGSANESLRRVARAAVRSDDAQLAALAKDRLAREVLTAYFVSFAGSDLSGWREASAPYASLLKSLEGWATALRKANLGGVVDADRLAWVAYEAGEFAQAKQWAALAPEDAWAAEWIRAKLALRDGNLPEGEARLRGAIAALPTNGARISRGDYRNDTTFIGHADDSESFSTADENRVRLFGELGRVCLARDEFTAALTAWIEGELLLDASYVAERIMKMDELRAYVDANCPENLAAPHVGDVERPWPNNVRRALRDLLARRLAREEKYTEAESYFSEDARKTYRTYLSDVRIGFDNSKPATERAAAFWRAAQTVRKDGMWLLGTEQDPDWTIFDGNRYQEAPALERANAAQQKTGGVFATTVAELERIKANVGPEKRFSYRYRAADLAWWAASLLPNDSDETARILYEAGEWLAPRDPEAANRFYQALVIRCGNTALGKAAAAKHWFPGKQ